jgi:hypothetical protein
MSLARAHKEYIWNIVFSSFEKCRGISRSWYASLGMVIVVVPYCNPNSQAVVKIYLLYFYCILYILVFIAEYFYTYRLMPLSEVG